jgi:membrane fusion protein, multidrug efflux system
MHIHFREKSQLRGQKARLERASLHGGEEIREQKRVSAIESGMISQNEVRSSQALARDVPMESVRPSRMSSFWRIVRWVILLGLLGGGLAFWKIRSTEAGGREGHQAREAARGPVPVVVGQAESRDFPIYLNALGTVQAYNSVTVRARVDGELQQIYFQEGQTVQKGDLLAQIDPRTYQAQVDQAKAKKAQDEAQLANAKIVLGRNAALIKSSVIDQQTYDAQKYSVDQLTALVAADQAAIDNAQTQLNYARITAPISGRIGIRLVDAGNIVHSTDTAGMLTINQVQPISVVFTLPQQDLGGVRDAIEQKKTLKVIALDRDNLSVLTEGTLEVLDNQIDSTTATLKLKAVFANTKYDLWPGQFVNVRLLLGTKDGAVTAPAKSIQRGPNGSYVYVIGADDKVAMRPVKVGATEDDWTLVESGLQAGDKVVVDGQYRLQPGAKVQATKDAGESIGDSGKPAKQ